MLTKAAGEMIHGPIQLLKEGTYLSIHHKNDKVYLDSIAERQEMVSTMIKPTALVLAIMIAVGAAQSPADSKDSKKKAKPATRAQKKPDNPDLKKGSELFGSSCASCHPGGRNKIKRSKPITGSWTLATLSTFKSYLDEPIGTMPHYEHIISDEKNLELLYKYVKTLESDSTTRKKSK